MIAVPFIGRGYSLDRLYAVTSTVLAVFFIIGCIKVSKYLKVRACFVILLVILPYFLCVTGVMYDVFGVPHVIILSSEGEQYDTLFTHDQESQSAKWLKEYSDTKIRVFTDAYGRYKLISQGNYPWYTWNRLMPSEKNDGYIYLRNYNLVYGKVLDLDEDSYLTTHNLSDYACAFNNRNLIYSNNGAEVYK
jgi:uncharacterized membrane protein